MDYNFFVSQIVTPNKLSVVLLQGLNSIIINA